eukprot:TRINITY_DN10449_c0_g1_i1.p1 TRINITY_DN10449_c0_g1~~TRINITY_DN10449_c0_g1_i1.p1  ORF type:complete len:553 (-),score=111.38 TRINITY_DN10449_c0_g1_i1:27-1685(-)
MGADPPSFSKLLESLAQQHEREIEEAVRRAKVLQNADATSVKSLEADDKFAAADQALEETKDATVLSVPLPNCLVEPLPAKKPRKPSKESLASAGSSCNNVEKLSVMNAIRKSSKERGGQEGLSARRKSLVLPSVPSDPVSRFVRSQVFDQISAALLLMNAVFIGVQVEFEFQIHTPVAIEAIDVTFCVCFILELCFRMWGYGCRHFWLDKEDRAWNIFDFIIVASSTLDTVVTAASPGVDSPLGNVSVLRVIRVVRIVRVIRIIRVMKFFQDLRILLAAIVSTVKTASFALILIMFIMYMFAIAITQLVAQFVKEQNEAGKIPENQEDLMFFFGGIWHSIFALFMTIAGGIDWKDAAVPLFEVGPFSIILFLLYTALMVLCVMNVLLGIFCQCALDTAATDKENVIQLQLQEKHRFIETLEVLFAGWDDSGDGRCSLEEFQNHLSDETTQALLRSLEIEGRDAITLFELLDADGSGEVDLDEFVTGCITLRGGAKAVHMEKLNAMHKAFHDRLEMLDTKLEVLDKQDRDPQDGSSNRLRGAPGQEKSDPRQ